MARTITRHVWLAKINRRSHTLFDRPFEEEIVDALSPDNTVTRYSRTWRLSAPSTSERSLVGKLGFVRRSAGASVTYDERLHDFVVSEAPTIQGNFAYYVLDLPTRILGFEERPPDIYRQSFLGALEGLLHSQGFKWDVDPLTDEASFEAWLRDVDVVTRFHATVNRPNPTPRRHAAEIRDLILEPKSDRFTVDATVDSDSSEGLQVDGTILGALADHAADGNGRFKMSARKCGSWRFFDSLRRLRSGRMTLQDTDGEPELVTQLTNIVSEAADEYRDSES